MFNRREPPHHDQRHDRHHGRHHHHHPRHHDPHGPASGRGIASLRRLLHSGNAGTVEDLAKAAAEYGLSAEDLAYFTDECGHLPPALALDMLDHRQRCRTFLQFQAVEAWAQGATIVILVPVPHHFYNAFARLPGATLVCLDHHQPAPEYRYADDIRICRDVFDAADLTAQADGVIFDGFPVADAFHVRRSIGGLLDERRLKSDARLLAHHRAHLSTTDVQLGASVAARVEQI